MLLPYTIEVYFETLGAYNESWSLGLILALLMAGFVVWSSLCRASTPGPAYLVLSLLCLSIALGHQFGVMTALNFMAPVYGLAWGFGALALSWVAIRPSTPGTANPVQRNAGIVLMGAGGIVFPALIGLWLQNWAAMPLVGVAPDPTALFLLGALLVLRAPMPLFLLPLGWAGVSAVSGYLLDFWGDYLVAILLLVGCAIRLVRR